jgi:hypothetical protein
MDINNGLNRLLRMRALKQYTGGQRSGSGGQKQLLAQQELWRW